jgi:hypothetical protein
MRDMDLYKGLFPVKIRVFVMNSKSKKFEEEDCEVYFITDAERQLFKEIFNSVSKGDND